MGQRLGAGRPDLFGFESGWSIASSLQLDASIIILLLSPSDSAMLAWLCNRAYATNSLTLSVIPAIIASSRGSDPACLLKIPSGLCPSSRSFPPGRYRLLCLLETVVHPMKGLPVAGFPWEVAHRRTVCRWRQVHWSFLG